MELFKNKILISLYSFWVSIHFYLFLIGGKVITIRPGKSYDVDTTHVFYPMQRYIDVSDVTYYDVSELFVYTVTPILLVFLFIALFKRK